MQLLSVQRVRLEYTIEIETEINMLELNNHLFSSTKQNGIVWW